VVAAAARLAARHPDSCHALGGVRCGASRPGVLGENLQTAVPSSIARHERVLRPMLPHTAGGHALLGNHGNALALAASARHVPSSSS
jgi:hypothetical protein